MPCPDIDDITTISRTGEVVNPEVREHLTTCETCNLDLHILIAARHLYRPDLQLRPEVQVPPGLNERVLAKIARKRVRRADVRPADTLVAAALGVATALAAVFVTEVANAPGVTPAELAFLAAAGGAAAAWMQSRAGKRDVDLALELI